MRCGVDIQSQNLFLTVKMTTTAVMINWTCSNANGRITTKFKNEENHKVELKDDPPTCLIEGTPTEPGDGWCGD